MLLQFIKRQTLCLHLFLISIIVTCVTCTLSCTTGIPTGPNLNLTSFGEGKTPDGKDILSQTLILQDSFDDRKNAVGGGIFGWRNIIDDQGRIEDSNGALASIVVSILRDPAIADGGGLGTLKGIGQMHHGPQALFFWGRNGPSNHSLYLINDNNIGILIADFDYVKISFSWQTFDLTDPKPCLTAVDTSCGESVPAGGDRANAAGREYLKVEYCNSDGLSNDDIDSLTDGCGITQNNITAQQRKINLKSEQWVSLFDPLADSSSDNNQRTGLGHSREDWNRDSVFLDLSKTTSLTQSAFFFRFNTFLRNGIKNANLTENGFYDATAIDNVIVEGLMVAK